MMEVNAFWFGFLIGVIAVFVLIMLVSLFGNRSGEKTEEIEISPEEYKAALESLTGKPMHVFRDSNGYLVGEPVEDPDDDD